MMAAWGVEDRRMHRTPPGTIRPMALRHRAAAPRVVTAAMASSSVIPISRIAGAMQKEMEAV